MIIRVLVADDHPIIRSGVIAILAENRDIEIVAEAASGRETLEALKKHEVDVLVLDLKMPDGGGFDVLGQIATWPKRPRVVVMSHFAEEHFAIQALRSGASGYLPKEAAPDQLVKAVRRVHAGGRYVTEALTDQLVEATDPTRAKAPHEHLSPREFQVFIALASAKKIPNIAADLAISVSTVHTMRRHVLEKFSTDNDVDLARYALVHQLID